MEGRCLREWRLWIRYENVHWLDEFSYLTLTHFGVTWRKTEEFMQQIGGMSPRTCHKWAETFIEEDYDDFVEDHRRGKRRDAFFDTFPELETKMKLYAIEGATRKNASFSSLELARYLDDQYYALTGEVRRFSSQLLIDCSCFLCSSLSPGQSDRWTDQISKNVQTWSPALRL